MPSFWHNTGVWRTDRQTDGVAVASTALTKRHAVKMYCDFVMAALRSTCGHYIVILWLISSFFPRLTSAVTDWLPYFHTWCGLCANSECMSEMCCTWLSQNTGHKKAPSEHHRTTLFGYIFATKACIDNRKKTVKQQYLLHMSPQYGELQPTNGWDVLASLGHPSKFQPVLRLGFVTAPTSLNGGQSNFARCLAVSWVGTLYIHFGGALAPNRILPAA